MEEGRNEEERLGGEEDYESKVQSTEQVFEKVEIPSWKNQVTLRALFTSLVLSAVFNFIVCKLNLTTGVIPSLNVAAGLLGFAFIKSWTAVLHKAGLLKQPFTRQENTVIQTCVVASSGIAFSSGTASYMLGMSPKIAAKAEEGNTPNNVKTLSIGWMLAFLYVVSFVGLFSIVPLRKMMILKYKLTYPSGTATAYLINSFHTPKGAKLAKKQVAALFKCFSFSFLFGGFQWFFAADDGCGFSSFPTFGLKAYAQRFYFDFSSTYVGVGMLCPIMVNVSLLIGAIISWGIMWPIIETKEGIWYPPNLSSSSLKGIQGYRVFLSIATMLGDGLFNFFYMILVTGLSFMKRRRSEKNDPASLLPVDDAINKDKGTQLQDLDDQRRTHHFMKDSIPNAVAVGGYIALAAVAIIAVPFIFPPLKWYHILVAYAIAPVLAFCNAYGCGLTDWSLASNYGKIAILIFSSWVGQDNGGVLAGLAACGVMMSIVSTASDLMQDFKTGYMTLASPLAMFFSQVAGTFIGCTLSPLVFWIFYKAYPLGDTHSAYPAPYAALYRAISLLGVEGFGSLPTNCLSLAIGFFVGAVAIDVLKEVLKKYETKYRVHRFVPNPMCMAIPFYLGGYFAIDMCVGSLILFVWRWKNKQQAKDFGPAVASGLICGESLSGIPAAILALAGIKAPICMKFLSAAANAKLEGS
nr:probable metal-nicotianamine transporter YSL7 [Ipomoea batatas]